ncbi:TPA: hypothetical protein NKO57_001258 [Pseudomonas aeruginosa]|nr:hypothetical protein [Pseudomonas aeruginosa]
MIEIFTRLTFESESLDTAFYRPEKPDDSTLAQDLNILATRENIDFSIQISDAFDEQIALPAQEDLSSFNVELVSFIKNNKSDTQYFFTTQGLLKNLDSSEISKSSNIYILEDFAEFKTLTCNFRKWDLCKPNISHKQDSEHHVDARKIVNDFTGSQINSNHLFWVTTDIATAPSEIITAWLKHSTPKASILLLSEISTNSNKTIYTLKGNKNLEFHANEKAVELPHSAHINIHNALNWIFDTARETEIRHTLLCQRLSHNNPKKLETWTEFIARTITPSLSAAKEDYKKHLLIKTGDLLKAITDIRKAVADETNKIIERTSNLTSNLLRDASIAFVIAVLRQTLITKNLLTKENASLLLLATAAWLVTSICLTSYQNKLVINSQIRFRRNWSKGLSSLVPESELKKISRRPLKDAISNYKKIKIIVSTIYATLVLIIASILIFT